MQHIKKILIIGIVCLLAISAMAQGERDVITLDNVDALQPVIEISDPDATDIQGGALSADGSLAVLLNIRSDIVQIMDTTSSEIILEIPEEGYPEILFSPDNSRVIITSEDAISTIYDLETGELLETREFYLPLAYSADGNVLMEFALDMETEQVLLKFTDADGGEISVVPVDLSAGFAFPPALSADGTTAVFGAANSVYVLDVENPSFDEPFVVAENDAEPDELINAVGINSDGSIIAFATEEEDKAFVYDVASGELLYEIDNTENGDNIDFLVFSPDDSLLYAVHYDVYRILDAVTGEELNRVGHNVAGRMAVFGVSEDLIFGASYEGIVGWGISAE